MGYFDHHYISKSVLLEFQKKLNPTRKEPENLEQIFDLGTLIDLALLEPHKANLNHKDIELAKEMAKAILKDPLLRGLIMMHDFKRKWEFYRHDLFGLPSRCQTDGWSRSLSTIFEYKGLGITSQNQFMESIYTFDYDLGAAWYLDTSRQENVILGAASKKKPDKVFKVLINREHKIYKQGLLKAELMTNEWKDFFGDSARGVEEIESFLT